MLTFYLICLILGGSLLAFSLLTGSDSDGFDDAEGLDFHGSDATIDIHSHDATEIAHLNSAEHKVDAADAVKFISMRNLIYFTAFFGLTGTILNFIGSTGIIAFISSVLLGGSSAVFGHKLMKYLKNTETGEGFALQNMIGQLATISHPIRKGGKGKILVTYNGQSFEMNAEMSDICELDLLKNRESVIILDIKNNTAKVVDSDT